MGLSVLPIASTQALGPTQSPIQWVPEALTPGVKRPGHEADHLPPCSDEIRTRGAVPLPPPFVFVPLLLPPPPPPPPIIIIIIIIIRNKSRDSSVGVATDYGLDDRGSIPSSGSEFFSSPPSPDGLWGPPSLLSNGYQGLFPCGVKRPGREADHSPPSSAEVKECVELYLHSLNTPSCHGA
jgi:hypothetical protein